MTMQPLRVLMVCMGNICRSPTAEAVLRHRLAAAGMQDAVEVDSAGTLGYHSGEPPDRRSQRHAARRGYDLSALRARQVVSADFGTFDFILAMDSENLEWLRDHCPVACQDKLRLLMSFAPRTRLREVPDPYAGGADGFEVVLDLVEEACDGFVAHISRQSQGECDRPV